MDGSIVSDPKSIEKTSKLNSKGEVVLTFSAEKLKKHIYYSVNFSKQIFDRKKLGEWISNEFFRPTITPQFI